MSKVLVDETSLSGIANSIRAKNGTTDTYKPSEMAAAISAIETGGGDLPEEAFNVTGSCVYRFANDSWDWFINNYGDRVVTDSLIIPNYMFTDSKLLETIPFELNFSEGVNMSCSYMFKGCRKLNALPKINNCRISNAEHLFHECYCLMSLPDDIESWFDWSYMDSQTSQYNAPRNHSFHGCRSLRSIPNSFLSHANKTSSYSVSYFYYGFGTCFALDELTDLPIPFTATWTNNAFQSAFSTCCHIKNLTFALNEGSPYVMNWKSQTIDVSSMFGWGNLASYFTNYNSGITADKQVTDDATYRALKDDPDWFACDAAYSRYNHDSAVATINSLPDTSAYLAANGGTNTIKFLGASGSATDGGAINTLTEEEIAVATAKGWTVSLV